MEAPSSLATAVLKQQEKKYKQHKKSNRYIRQQNRTELSTSTSHHVFVFPDDACTLTSQCFCDHGDKHDKKQQLTRIRQGTTTICGSSWSTSVPHHLPIISRRPNAKWPFGWI